MTKEKDQQNPNEHKNRPNTFQNADEKDKKRSFVFLLQANLRRSKNDNESIRQIHK